MTNPPVNQLPPPPQAPPKDAPFEQTPEAQEYLQKLQQERIRLPSDASMLEHKAVEKLKEMAGRIRALTTALNDNKQRIQNMTDENKMLELRTASLEGEMAAYASLLVMAEGSRRAPACPAAPKGPPEAFTKDKEREAAGVEVKEVEGVDTEELDRIDADRRAAGESEDVIKAKREALERNLRKGQAKTAEATAPTLPKEVKQENASAR